MDFILEPPRRSHLDGPDTYPAELLERPTTRLDYVPEHYQILDSPRNNYPQQQNHQQQHHQQQHQQQQHQRQLLAQQQNRVSKRLF